MANMIKKVLVVDDQPEVGAQIGAYLKHLGIIPAFALSVGDVIAGFDPNIYRLIICDVMMPGKNGFDLVRFIRNEFPQIPVVLVSGYFDKQMEELQKVFGIGRIYRKPVFLNTVKQMLAEMQELTAQ